MDNPKISVIVPVYKVEPYLCRCLDSIVNQTYQNLEIILVDDGSPDNSGAICDEYAANDDRVMVIHTKNRGAYAARNTALDNATGGYIAFVDADDWIDPGMCERLLDLLREYKADISQCEMKNEGEYAQIRNSKLGDVELYEKEQLKRAFFEEYITHGLLGKLFRAEIWCHMRFDEEHYHVDAMTMSRIDLFCDRYVRLDDELYHYNTTNESITRGNRNPLHIKSAEILFEEYSRAAQSIAEGSFFVCREIPSTGRLIPSGGQVTRKMAHEHIKEMHGIFVKHWGVAKKTEKYKNTGKAKKLLWHIYYRSPVVAAGLVRLYSKFK